MFAYSIAVLVAVGIDPELKEPVRTIGMEGSVVQTIAGSQLEVIPVTDKSPVVVWIKSTKLLADAIRYEIRYVGWEPGKYDLSRFLRRRDGSTNVPIPPISVDVVPVLAEGKIDAVDFDRPDAEPVALKNATWKYAVVVVCFVLTAIIIMIARLNRPRRNRADSFNDDNLDARVRDLAGLALLGNLSRDGKARLERMMTALWQERLAMTELSPTLALPLLRQHPEAGPVIRTLEAWTHRPAEVSPSQLREVLLPFSGSDDGNRPAEASANREEQK